MSADVAVSVDPALKNISLRTLFEWLDNPRRTHDPAKHTELVDSIRSGGLLQPLLARPVGGGFEVVCGNRRLRALLEIHTSGEGEIADVGIPCLVRELNDDEAVAAAIKENGDRDGMQPLEEAEAFARLNRDGTGLDAEDIAALTGKSEQLVRARLRLMQLRLIGRRLLGANLLPLGGAMAVAQLEQKKQLDVLRQLFFFIGKDEKADDVVIPDDEEGVSASRVRDVIAGHDHDLKRAPFNILDAELVAAAGACSTCPKRTKAQAFMFGDAGDDACLDHACWDAKEKAKSAALVEKAKATGSLLVVENLGDIFSSWGRYKKEVEYNSDYVDVDDEADDWVENLPPEEYSAFEAGKKPAPTWRELLERSDRAGAIAVIVDPDGRARELITRKVADEIAGMDKPSTSSTSSASTRATGDDSYKKQQEKSKAEQAAARRLQTALAKAATTRVNAASFNDLLRVLALELGQQGYPQSEQLAKLASAVGVAAPKKSGNDGLVEMIEAADSGTTAARIVLLYRLESGNVERLSGHLGVDVAAVKKEQAAQEKVKIGAKKEKKATAPPTKTAEKPKPKGLGNKTPAKKASKPKAKAKPSTQKKASKGKAKKGGGR